MSIEICEVTVDGKVVADWANKKIEK